MIPQSMDGPVGPSTPTVERRVSIKSTISPLLVEPLCGGLDCIWQSTGICSLQAYIAMRNDRPPNVRPLASDPTRKGTRRCICQTTTTTTTTAANDANANKLSTKQ
jgi:hypothetical protein